MPMLLWRAAFAATHHQREDRSLLQSMGRHASARFLNAIDPVDECQHLGAVVLMAATSATYWRAAEEAGARGRPTLPCVVVSVSTDVPSGEMARASYAKALWLPAASWRPEERWCQRTLSGWRHTHLLKTQGLVHVLSRGFDCLLTDTDWQLFSPDLFFDAMRRLAVDVVAPREDCVGLSDKVTKSGCHRINLGFVWIRQSPLMLQLARRISNRSYAAWDQAIFLLTTYYLLLTTYYLLLTTYYLLLTSCYLLWDQAIFNEEVGNSVDSTCCFLPRPEYAQYAQYMVDRGDRNAKHNATPTECVQDRQPVHTLGPPTGRQRKGSPPI